MLPSDPSSATKLRVLIEARGNPTQEEIAKALGVRREYISRILNGLEPSDQLKRAIELMLKDAQSANPSTSGFTVQAVHEKSEETDSGADEKRRALQAHFSEVIRQAGDDTDRLGWIAIQLREHLRAPASWQTHDEINRRAIAMADRLAKEREKLRRELDAAEKQEREQSKTG